MDKLTELFCLVDNFCQVFEPQWEQHLLTTGSKQRRRAASLSLSELMTLAILFHQLRFRHFKTFYQEHVQAYLHREFPRLPSYNRCVELMPSVLASDNFRTLSFKANKALMCFCSQLRFYKGGRSKTAICILLTPLAKNGDYARKKLSASL